MVVDVQWVTKLFAPTEIIIFLQEELCRTRVVSTKNYVTSDSAGDSVFVSLIN